MLQGVELDKVSSSVPSMRSDCGLRVGRDDPISSAPQGRSNIKLVEVGLFLKSERDKRKRFPLSRVHDSESGKRRQENDQKLRESATHVEMCLPPGCLELSCKVIRGLGNGLHDCPKSGFPVSNEDCKPEKDRRSGRFATDQQRDAYRSILSTRGKCKS
jgi:hypothetical protein